MRPLAIAICSLVVVCITGCPRFPGATEDAASTDLATQHQDRDSRDRPSRRDPSNDRSNRDNAPADAACRDNLKPDAPRTEAASPDTIILDGPPAETFPVLIAISVTPALPQHFCPGTTMQFAASAKFIDGTTQPYTTIGTWTSSNLAVATISNAAGSEGMMTTSKPGISKISMSSGAYVISNQVDVVVLYADPVQLSIQPTAPVLALNTTMQLSALVLSTCNDTWDWTGPAMWTSSDPSVVEFDATIHGRIKGISPDSAQVTAKISLYLQDTVLVVVK